MMKRVLTIGILVHLIFAWTSTVLAVTPLPFNEKLLGAAPEECLLYYHSSGFTTTDPNATNKTEQLMLEPSVKAFVDEIKSVIDQFVMGAVDKVPDAEAQAMMRESADLGKLLMNRPFTIYLADMEIDTQRDMPTNLDGALVIDVGDEAAQVEKRINALLQKRLTNGEMSNVTVAGLKCNRIQPPNADAPPFHWGRIGDKLVVTMGDDAMTSLIANAKSPAPKWLAPAMKRIDVPRRWNFGYVNTEKFVALICGSATAEVPPVLNALGVQDLTSATVSVGLDKQGMLSRWLIGTESDKGILGWFKEEGVTAKDLAEVPQDVVACFAMRMDPKEIAESMLELAVEIAPGDGEEVAAQLDALSESIGVNIREELIGGLGDRWVVYVTGIAGMVPNMVIAIDVRDEEGIQSGLELLNAAMEQNGGGQISVADTKVGDRPAYYLKGAPVAPVWCLTKDRLIIATQKSSISKLLDSPPAPEASLAAHPKVKSMFSEFKAPLLFTYNDGKTGLTTLNQFVPMFINMSSAALEEQGIDFDVTNIPPMADVVKHIDPTVGVINRSKDGVEFCSRKTLPSISGAAVPVGVAVLLPAVQAARASARRVQSMNNLKQIGLACLNFESAMRALPAAKIGDGENNGLSWRVAILPYMEGGAELYDEFNLDEPWDSEHNKTLIAKMPAVYRSPAGNTAEGKTNYLAVRREDSIITGEGVGTRMRDIKDGTSKTILALEVDDTEAVIWTKPDDYEWDEDKPTKGLGDLHPGKIFLSLFCDGSIQTISKDVDEDVMKAMYTRNGGEVVQRP